MGSASVQLYAKWTTNPTYTVTYDGNDPISGSVPTDSTNYTNGQTVTVAGNTGSLTKTGYTFAGWCGNSTGSGTSYSQGNTFTINSNVTLYAMWNNSHLDNILASEDLPGTIQVSWTENNEAEKYIIYRSLSSEGNYSKINESTYCQYYDNSAIPGQIYYYKISYAFGENESDLSDFDDGKAGYSVPSISVSNGTYRDHVRVSWSSKTGIDYYKIFRSNSQNGEYLELSNWTAQTYYDDYTVSLGVTYFYKLKIKNNFGESELGSYNSGKSNLSVPTNVVASNGTSKDSITITWNSVEGATSYEVYRSYSSYKLVATVSSTTYTDRLSYGSNIDGNLGLFLPALTYDYLIRAKNEQTTSANSSSDEGWTAYWDNTDWNITYDAVKFSWDNIGASQYYVYHYSSANNIYYYKGTITGTSINTITLTNGLNTVYIIAKNSNGYMYSNWKQVYK